MKFRSKTHVAINVVLKSGANVHVTFMELTGKGSVYYTNNAEVAEALRNHYKFGKLFKEEQEQPVVAAKPATKVTGTERSTERNEARNETTLTRRARQLKHPRPIT